MKTHLEANIMIFFVINDLKLYLQWISTRLIHFDLFRGYIARKMTR